MNENKPQKAIKTAPSQLEKYLDGYIRREMYASFTDFLKGEPRKIVTDVTHKHEQSPYLR
jgi:hypothetical protein